MKNWSRESPTPKERFEKFGELQRLAKKRNTHCVVEETGFTGFTIRLQAIHRICFCLVQDEKRKKIRLRMELEQETTPFCKNRSARTKHFQKCHNSKQEMRSWDTYRLHLKTDTYTEMHTRKTVVREGPKTSMVASTQHRAFNMQNSQHSQRCNDRTANLSETFVFLDYRKPTAKKRKHGLHFPR